MRRPTKRAAHRSHPCCKPLRNSIDHHIRLRQLLDHNDVMISFSFNVNVFNTPPQLIEMILNKKANSLNKRGEHPQNYVLKVCGRQEYLVGNRTEIIQFLYIQETLARDGVPQLKLVGIDKLPINYENTGPTERQRSNSDQTNTMKKKRNRQECSWKIDSYFSCTIVGVSGLNIDAGRNVETQSTLSPE
ncbi:hypothetical protein EVAR_74910_1 [Eumeta japonica]|uniref:PI3K-RBD domain-containing protein n=1 Tax=Eumeta variegata TaxID=151549 RepID=A0A4C1UIA7_EUMVA|nr:hypothetical protein EVAR_74910_1 [Eumeta japonica]